MNWKAPIKPIFVRTKRWYMCAAGVVLAIAAYGVLSGAWTVALVAILCGAMYVIVHDHRLPDATMTFTESGAQLNTAFLAWKEMKGYWLLYTPEYTELHLVPAARKPEMVIQTGSQEIMHIKQTLAEYVPEMPEMHERLLDTFIRICKL